MKCSLLPVIDLDNIGRMQPLKGHNSSVVRGATGLNPISIVRSPSVGLGFMPHSFRLRILVDILCV